MKIFKTTLFFVALAIGLTCITSCSDSEEDSPIPHTKLKGSQIIVSNIQGVPDGLHIEHLSADIKGYRQKVIGASTGLYDGKNFVIDLPATIGLNQLFACQWNVGQFLSGFWPAVSSDPTANVAHLADIIAYNGTEAIGRVYLTDWSGEGSAADKAFIYYHYADKEFALSGYNLNVYETPVGFKPSYYYKAATFKPGWNAYANINPSSEGVMTCTTDISEKLNLQWRFEVWKK